MRYRLLAACAAFLALLSVAAAQTPTVVRYALMTNSANTRGVIERTYTDQLGSYRDMLDSVLFYEQEVRRIGDNLTVGITIPGGTHLEMQVKGETLYPAHQYRWRRDEFTAASNRAGYQRIRYVREIGAGRLYQRELHIEESDTIACIEYVDDAMQLQWSTCDTGPSSSRMERE